MPLVLRVLSAQNRTAGFEGTKTFEAGGTIGRTPDNDWALPDPDRIVSSHHAAITCEGGRYFIADRSTNGIGVNGREMQKGGRIELRPGDQLTIGGYQITVSVENAAARAPAIPAYASTPAPPASFDDIFSAPSPFAVAGGEPTLDPLVALGAGDKSRQKAPAPQYTTEDHSNAESAFFEPPRVVKAPPAAPRRHGEIPENWDATGFAAVEPAAPPVAPAHQAPPPPAPRARAATQAPPPDWAAEESASPPAQPVRPAASVSPASALDLSGVLRAAGIDPATVDPSLAASLGEVLRVVIEGLMAVLKARAEIKNQFRVAMTTLKPVDNNPLKFSIDANDALSNLFGKRTASYQSPVNAFRDAFEDLKAHQMAMMAGMRAAFTELMTRFDPDQLQETFDRGMKRSAILGVMNKTKYWDLYRDMYAALGDDDATFRRLFGDEFAQAYEEQMQRLAALRGKR